MIPLLPLLHQPLPTTATPTDPQGTYVTYNYGTDADAGWSKLLTSITTTEVDENNNQTTSTQTIDYDAIGNPTSYLGANMTWFTRQLKTYSKNGTTVSYTYDANGLRATKTVNGTKSTYVYVNGLLTYEKRGDIEIYFWYDSYGHLMALRCFGVQDNNPYYYVLTNIQGDVLGIYDPTGELVVSYEYDTWGNLINMTDTSGVNIGTINPIRYRGYYYDTETGLYYLQSRYYDPQVGRFINADAFVSTGQGLLGNNMFIYCGNNPINNYDPNGLTVLYANIGVNATCIWGLGVSIQIAFDSYGNIGLQYNYAGFSFENMYAGVLDAGATISGGYIWGADTIYDLQGSSTQFGASTGFFRYGGFDLIWLPNSKNAIDGIQIGIGWGIGAEIHVIKPITKHLWTITQGTTHTSSSENNNGGRERFFRNSNWIGKNLYNK